MILKLMFNPRVRLALLAVVLLAAVLFDCDGDSGGMWQGGGDSEPGWR